MNNRGTQHRPVGHLASSERPFAERGTTPVGLPTTPRPTRSSTTRTVPALLLLLLCASGPAIAQSQKADPLGRYFTFTVIDAQDNRPVPDVRLTTVNNIRRWSDGQGMVAFHEPGLMGRRVFFYIHKEGYDYPPDHFKYRGRAFTLTPGGRATIKFKRTRKLPLPKSTEPVRDSLMSGKPVPSKSELFQIRVIDDVSGRGVPLVELTVSPRVRYVTDSAGLCAFYEPQLMGRTVRLTIRSHGYQFRGEKGPNTTRLHIRQGGEVTLKVRRLNVAERLYRLTGAGIYRDSVLLGYPTPLRHPLLNGLVCGQDSVLTALYRGQIFWIWGDTNRPAYPLGLFHVSGATSEHPSRGGLDPQRGVDLRYFVGKSGFSRPMVRLSKPGTATWIGTLFVVPDRNGRDQLFAHYGNFKGLSAQQRGFARYNDATQLFESIYQYEMTSKTRPPLVPAGGSIRVRVGGVDHVYFPLSMIRVRAKTRRVSDIRNYQAFTPLKPSAAGAGRLGKNAFVLDRDRAGTIRYQWRSMTPAVFANTKRIGPPKWPIPAQDALYQFREPSGDGALIGPHGGTIRWNPFRQRYLMLFLEAFGGPSPLGEVWYAEADSPLGPWVYARKVVTHDRYTFYNVWHHAMLDKHGGRRIFFEGTYTNTFVNNPDATPRYNYNQIMYSLDLRDQRLALPLPVYDLGRGAPEQLGRASALRAAGRDYPLAFFAPDRPMEGTLPVYLSRTSGNPILQLGGSPAKGAPVAFHALSADSLTPPKTTQPLHEFVNSQTGERAYSVQAGWTRSGFARSAQPLCRVWRNPMSFQLPVASYQPPE